MAMIDSSKYGTASETAEAAHVKRTTLYDGVKRGEIVHDYTIGGTLLIDVESAIEWAKQVRKTGPKPKT